MTEPANDLRPLEAATTEGLEELFEAEVIPGATTDSLVPLTEAVPVEEAARILGLSVKTVKDRLRKGTLTGYKAPDKFGEKWMVCLDKDHLVVLAHGRKDLPGTTDSVVPPVDLQALIGLLETKDRELQAAAFRNGYLEAQLAERDQQIKLLTDSQYKPSWLLRFRSWFTGQ